MIRHSSLFIQFNYLCVAVSLFMLALSLWLMPLDLAMKGYLGMGILFLSSSLVTLVKTLRDVADSEQLASKLEAAKQEKLLSKYAVSDAS